MSNIFSTLKWVILICFGFLLGSIALPFMAEAVGYYAFSPGWEVAKELVEKDKDVGGCRKIVDVIWWDIIVPEPPVQEQRALCVLDYARLKSDPSACESLLPSRYGWKCVGESGQKFFSGRLCTTSGSFENPELYCTRESEGELMIQNPQIADCSLYARKDIREWCYDSRTQKKEGVHDCAKITREVVRDHCEFMYASREKDPELCDVIADENRRSYCETFVDFLIKYPPQV